MQNPEVLTLIFSESKRKSIRTSEVIKTLVTSLETTLVMQHLGTISNKYVTGEVVGERVGASKGQRRTILDLEIEDVKSKQRILEKLNELVEYYQLLEIMSIEASWTYAPSTLSIIRIMSS